MDCHEIIHFIVKKKILKKKIQNTKSQPSQVGLGLRSICKLMVCKLKGADKIWIKKMKLKVCFTCAIDIDSSLRPGFEIYTSTLSQYIIV